MLIWVSVFITHIYLIPSKGVAEAMLTGIMSGIVLSVIVLAIALVQFDYAKIKHKMNKSK